MRYTCMECYQVVRIAFVARYHSSSQRLLDC